MYTIFAPLALELSSKRFYLNLNTYRNAHYHTLNKAKVLFCEEMREEIAVLPVFNTPLHIRYILNPGSNRKMDISNVLSIVDKFFCDALVHYGKLPDDNYEHIQHVSYLMGEVNPKHGNVIIDINEI